MDRGTMIAVPATIMKTVNLIGPYFGSKRVDQALCHPQQTADDIINRSPIHALVSESALFPKITIAAAPLIERTIPVNMPELNRSRFIATPIKSEETGIERSRDQS